MQASQRARQNRLKQQKRKAREKRAKEKKRRQAAASPAAVSPNVAGSMTSGSGRTSPQSVESSPSRGAGLRRDVSREKSLLHLTSFADPIVSGRFTANAMRRMHECFDEFDSDGDEWLGPHELVNALSQLLERNLSAADVARMFARSGVVEIAATEPAPDAFCGSMRYAFALTKHRLFPQPLPIVATAPAAVGPAPLKVGGTAAAGEIEMVESPFGASERSGRGLLASAKARTATAAAGSGSGAAASGGGADAAAGAAAAPPVPIGPSSAEAEGSLSPPGVAFPAEFLNLANLAETKRKFSFEDFNALHDHLLLKTERVPVAEQCKHFATRMYHPCEPFKTRWDTFLGIVLMYSLISIPFRVCLNIPAEMFGAFWCFDLGVDIYFLIDMCLTFRTGIFEHENAGVSGRVYVDDACKVAKDYFKLWFWIDLVTSLPISSALEVLGRLTGAFQPGRGTIATKIPRMLRIVRILRLLKLLRLAKLAKLLKNWQNRQTVVGKMVRFIKLFGAVCFIAHLLGCTICAVGGLMQADVDTGELPSNGWLVTDELTGYTNESDIDKGWVYLLSLYWAVMTLTTVGYGDITPSTTVEVLVVIGAMFIGTCAFGYIVGSVTSVIMEEDRGATLVREKIDEISSYMRSRKLPSTLQERVREYFDFVWKTSTVFDENQLLEDLPSFLRNDVVREAYGELIDEVPMLSSLCPSELTALIIRLRPLRVLPSQVIVRKGECGTEMFIVSGGLLRRYADDYKHASFMMGVRDLKQGRKGTMLPGEQAPKEERPPYANERSDLLARGDFFGEYCIIEAVSREESGGLSGGGGGGVDDNDDDDDDDDDDDGETDWSIHARHPYTVVAIEVSLLLFISRMQYEECKMLFPHVSHALANGQDAAHKAAFMGEVISEVGSDEDESVVEEEKQRDAPTMEPKPIGSPRPSFTSTTSTGGGSKLEEECAVAVQRPTPRRPSSDVAAEKFSELRVSTPPLDGGVAAVSAPGVVGGEAPAAVAPFAALSSGSTASSTDAALVHQIDAMMKTMSKEELARRLAKLRIAVGVAVAEED